MIQEKRSKRGALLGLAASILVLVLVIVLENTLAPTSQLFVVLKKGAVYSLVAVSMNLVNGFTGLFSLGQAGFMLLGAYTYAILTIPSADRESVYYLYGGSAVNFSLPELFGGGALGLILGVLAALILAGCVAAVIAWLIGLPVLRLKSDYLPSPPWLCGDHPGHLPVGPAGPCHQRRQRAEELSHLLQLQHRERQWGGGAALSTFVPSCWWQCASGSWCC